MHAIEPHQKHHRWSDFHHFVLLAATMYEEKKIESSSPARTATSVVSNQTKSEIIWKNSLFIWIANWKLFSSASTNVRQVFKSNLHLFMCTRMIHASIRCLNKFSSLANESLLTHKYLIRFCRTENDNLYMARRNERAEIWMISFGKQTNEY